ncbi:MAG: signal peptidase I [Candidatus Korobacteraceae bacterium]
MSEVRTEPEVTAVTEQPRPVLTAKPRLHVQHVNTLQSLAITVVIAVFVVTFIVQAFQIPSESMERTLLVGDYLLVDKAHYGHSRVWGWLLPYRPVQHQDIIVFRYPVNPKQHFVKRVVGLPGDHIRLINKHVYVNGEPQADSFAQFNWSQHDKFRDNFPNNGQFGDRTTTNWFLEGRKLVEDDQLIVPQGYYFVLGDNRDDSYDSRYWGLVPAENVVGRPLIIYWSMPRDRSADDGGARSDRLSTLAYSLVQSFKGLRWDRMFHVPH